MVYGTEIVLDLCGMQAWLAQISVEGVSSPEDATLSFSVSGWFLVLIAGLMLAFAFQLLLANFFIALGISYPEQGLVADSEADGSNTLDDTINQVGAIVGLRTLGTVSITLFTGCFLAVKLGVVHDALLGAILGLVIWAAYFCLLVWASVTTVSSLIGSVLNRATLGLQGLLGTVAVAFGAKTVSEQVVSTAEAAAATIRRELSTATDLSGCRVAIDKYLEQLRLPEADRQEIEAEFEKLVSQPQMKSIASNNNLQNIRRQTFVDLVSSRTDFSKQDVNQAVESFEAFWQRFWGVQQQKDTTPEWLDYFKSVQPEELNSGQLSTQLEQLIEQTRKFQAQQQAQAAQKVAETAAWWLFGTAFTSAAASAVAGALSVRG